MSINDALYLIRHAACKSGYIATICDPSDIEQYTVVQCIVSNVYKSPSRMILLSVNTPKHRQTAVTAGEWGVTEEWDRVS